MSKDFASIHTHTSFSTLDGASKIPGLVQQMKALGMTSGGISDHGNLSGIIDFYKECKKHEIHPVLGQEFYFCDDRTLKQAVQQEDANGAITGSDKRYYHLSIYAADNDGYQNLLKLSSDAFENGMYYKPRSDYAMLERHSKGLIVGSGCLGGPVLQPLLYGDFDGALAVAQRLQDCVGKDNFYIELMNHFLPEQLKTNPMLIEIAKRIGAQVYATQDTHYTHQEESHAHSIMLCCQTGSKLSDEKRFHFHNDEYYLKSPDQMYDLFKDLPEACDNTLVIAERCNVQIDFKSLHLPKFPIPWGFSDDMDYLTHLTKKGIDKFYPNANDEVYERAAYELSVFQSMGVSSYMLILWDLLKFARNEGIFTPPGRGSAAGSLVSYVLGITKVDPLEYGLIFERFLNPSRIALPDVDLDIEQRYREKMINYTIQKYGTDHVAQIITFGTMKARTAVKDTARVLGYEPAVGNKITKLMPPLASGVDTPLSACLELNPKYENGFKAAQGLREEYDRDPDVKKIIDAALGIEGQIKSLGIHAAAVVIGDRPLDELVPTWKNSDGVRATQWGKKTIEDMGLVKMDYLGLKNLDILSDTQKLIGNGFSIDDLPMDDPETYSMLRTGNSLGCFQIESGGMRQLLKRLAPDNIRDISAVLALFRPGPMASNWHNMYADRKNGREAVTVFHPDAAEILKDTYGLMIYQEEIMEIATVFAGYSLTEADNLRKIIGKKLPDEMKAEAGKFIAGCVSQGHSEEFGKDLFDTIDGFSLYGFNLSHSVSYAFITYWTAYLKTHYPREYMSVLCSYVMDDLDKTARYLGEARRMGLKVYPPDVNKSTLHYTVEEDGIRIGLGTLKNMGEDSALKLIEIREQEPFKDLYDLAIRVNPKAPALRSLAYSGALDGWGTRQGIASVVDEVLKVTRKDAKKIDQGSLFETAEIVNFHIPETEYSWHELLSKEKEVLGIYASGHPLEDYTEHATGRSIMDASEAEEKASVKMLAIVTDVVVKYTKAQKAMANVLIEDQTGALELVAFPKSFEDYGSVLQPGAVVRVTIRKGYDDFREQPNYVLTYAEPVESKIATATLDQFGIFVPKGFHTKPVYMSKLKGVLLQNHGTIPADIYISRSTKIKLENQYLVNGSQKLKDELKALFVEFRGEG